MPDYDLLTELATMIQLAKENPDEFEARRSKLLATEISKAPKSMQFKLKQLQWRLDGIRLRASSPLETMLKFQSMMLELVEKKQKLFQEVAELSHSLHPSAETQKPQLKLVYDAEQPPV